MRGSSSGVVGAWSAATLILFVSIGQVVAQEDSTLLVKIFCGLLSLVVVACFLRMQSLLVRGRPGRQLRTLAGAQVVASLLVLALGGAWMTLALALTTVLLLTAWPQRFLLVAGLGALDVAVMLGRHDGTSNESILVICVTTVVIAFTLYSMTRLYVVLDELRRTREQIARVRVDEERLRISRDLHDLLGRTLVSASLRNEAALRLLDHDIERCRDQLTALRSSIIDGQARLRALTSGPTLIGLNDELASARELFERLGLRAEVDAVVVDDPAIDQTLAAVVREAVTNTLKHGQPTWCRIGVRHESLAIVVSVVNDGVTSTAQDGGAHTGLDDIRARVESLGGVLTAGPVPGGQFRVIARVPRVPALTPDGDAALELTNSPETAAS
ncbi:histidine kinase [Kineosporia rhizophila]|uniref:sensor histidine kinase n=1 Tax=Kineosporia TaxID=49184 RepID=UPI001E427D02|nr:histidine kinase [Kineosporia sp. NBRC 101677]MCE0539266.1 histidine kinase [Kineosporia rhizophila]